MNEFDLIARYFAPLAAGRKGALGLKDDAALISVPRGHELVITKDAIAEGVHFIGDEPPDLIAQKLLRVNLSDLAAMGAAPYAYFLALMLPASTDEKWLRLFAKGLSADQETYGITLMGGDTTRTHGPLSLSATALGLVPAGRALTRGGAKPGDDIYVSGTLGDAALGLGVAKGVIAPSPFLLDRYRLPSPRVKLGKALRGIATFCTDISDGLAQDLGHICECSGVGAEIRCQDIPLSKAARTILAKLRNPYETILAGGDDYELVFTSPSSDAAKIRAAARKSRTDITLIGRIIKGSGVRLLDGKDQEIFLINKGYRHF